MVSSASTTRFGGNAPRSERHRADRAAEASVQWMRGWTAGAAAVETGTEVGIRGGPEVTKNGNLLF